MDELKQRAETQLGIIESAYSIKILNKGEIVSLIAGKLKDKRQILMVCTSLNSWIASNDIRGEAVIPINIVLSYIDAAN
jgi:hypothetical protein